MNCSPTTPATPSPSQARFRAARARRGRRGLHGRPLNVYGILGLNEGDAHVIRNAGGVIIDDEIRSLAISQRLLGTSEIILIHHTDCGMLTFTDDAFKASIQEETGLKPAWSAEAFGDLDTDVRQSIARIKASPFVPKKDAIRGFVFDVATGKLNDVV
jgi:carbonic anhydrase